MATTKEERAAIDAKVKDLIRPGYGWMADGVASALGLSVDKAAASLARLVANGDLQKHGRGIHRLPAGDAAKAEPKRKAAKLTVDVATAFVPAGREPKKGDLLVANARAWKADRKAAKRGGA